MLCYDKFLADFGTWGMKSVPHLSRGGVSGGSPTNPKYSLKTLTLVQTNLAQNPFSKKTSLESLVKVLRYSAVLPLSTAKDDSESLSLE